MGRRGLSLIVLVACLVGCERKDSRPQVTAEFVDTCRATICFALAEAVLLDSSPSPAPVPAPPKPKPAPSPAPVPGICPNCKGTGKLDGDGRTRPDCPVCGGDGKIDGNETKPPAPPPQPKVAPIPELKADPTPPIPARRVLFFTATWCGKCRDSKLEFESWLKAAGWKIGTERWNHVQFVDVDVERALVLRYGVSSLPTLVVVDANGIELERGEYTGRDAIPALLNVKPTTPAPAISTVPTTDPLPEGWYWPEQRGRTRRSYRWR